MVRAFVCYDVLWQVQTATGPLAGMLTGVETSVAMGSAEGSLNDGARHRVPGGDEPKTGRHHRMLAEQ